jgi:hypothetical protein
MKNETHMRNVVPENSVRALNELHAVALFEECDLADTPGGQDEFWMDLRRRELTLTSTLAHILEDHQSVHDLRPRH